MRTAGESGTAPFGLRHVKLLYAILIGLLVFAVYYPAAANDFVMFDDDINIYNNPMLGELSLERIKWAFADSFYMPRYMPLGWISLMAIFEFGGLNPAAYHTVNIVVHALNAALVFLVILRGLELAARFRDQPVQGSWFRVIAICGAFFWAIHPLRVEPVSWATGLHYLHASFWAFVCILLFWRHYDSDALNRRWFLGASYVAYALSVMVYPVTLGLPVALWAFEWWLKSNPARPVRWLYNFDNAREHLPLLLLSAIGLLANIVMRRWVPSIFPASPGLETFGILDRGLQASYSAIYYVIRPLYAGEVTPVYGALFENGRFGVLPWLCLVLVAATFAFICLRGRSYPGVVAWLVATVAVGVSYYGLLESPFQNSDRYTYFPTLILVIALAVFILLRIHGKGRQVLVGCVLPGLAWLYLGVNTHLPVWRDDRVFFDHIAQSLLPYDIAYIYKGRLAVKQALCGDEEAARVTVEEIKKAGASLGVISQIEEEVNLLYRRARGAFKLESSRGFVAPDAQTAQMYAVRSVRTRDDWTTSVRFERALAIDSAFTEARYNYVLWLAFNGQTGRAWDQYIKLRVYSGRNLDRALDRNLMSVMVGASRAVGDSKVLAYSSLRLSALETEVLN
jgi:hypothetical protein